MTLVSIATSLPGFLLYSPPTEEDRKIVTRKIQTSWFRMFSNNEEILAIGEIIGICNAYRSYVYFKENQFENSLKNSLSAMLKMAILCHVIKTLKRAK